MSNPKELRKQLRNVCQDLAPELLKNEIFAAMYVQLQQENNVRLQALEKQVKETLARMDERAKDVQAFIMRQVASQLAGTEGPDTSAAQHQGGVE